MNTRIANKKKYFILGLTLLLLVLALLICGYFLLKENKLNDAEWNDVLKNGVFHEGIKVDGLDIGNMTMEKAGKALKENLLKRLGEIALTLNCNGRQFTLTKENFTITDNIDGILKEAIKVGREGSILSVQQEIDNIKKNGREFFSDYTIDPASIQSVVEGIAAELDTAPIDATLKINKDDVNKRFEYTDAVDGLKVDKDALIKAISGLAESKKYGSLDIPVTPVPAAITTDMLKAKTLKRSSAKTFYGKSPYNASDRVHNLKKAADIINGYILKPGEEFSTNAVLGPRTYELGWKPAPAIVRGTTEDQAGGGVCQIATTMYNAVLKADLEIVYRRGHSLQLSYVDGGLDATIDTDRIDFKYKNNTESDIYIFCWLDEKKKYVNFEMYGVSFPAEFDEIKLESEKTQTIKPSGEMLITVDNTKEPGYREEVVKRRDGAVYKSYKLYYKDGQLIKKEQIAETKYKAYSGETIVGPEPVQTPVPSDISNILDWFDF